jgi:putative ABC transport system permease protein
VNKLVFANLVHRPIRTLISVLAIAIEVTLILVIVGLSLGILNDNKERTKGTGADAMVRPPGSSNVLTISGAPMPIKVGDVVKKLPHVTVVAPVVLQLVTGGALETIYGIDLASFDALGSPFHYLEGGPFEQPYDIIVDDYFAASKKAHVGDSVDVLNHKFRICGIVEHGKGGRKFIRIDTLQDLAGAQGKATMLYVKLDDPKNFPAFKAAATQALPTYSIISMEEWLTMVTPDNLPGFSIFINVVIGVSVCIGFIVIFQSMYTAVMERTREIGILKSLGASKAYIANVILRETVLLAIVGIIVGLALSLITAKALVAKFPTLRVTIYNEWVIKAAIIAIIGAMLGAIYPAIKAARKDPIDALAYE